MLAPSGQCLPWRPGLNPAKQIIELNRWMRRYAEGAGIEYVDYYSLMANPDGGLKAELSSDGVHPNEKGYGIMTPPAARAIAAALSRPR